MASSSISPMGMGSLISGIERDAQREANGILEEAKKESQRRLLYAEKQAESIIKEAEEKGRKQAESIKTRLLSGVQIEAKRRSMQIQENVFNEVLEGAQDGLRALIGKKRYRGVLLNLITEAAIGLGAERARVNASREERGMIDDSMLRGVEKRFQTLTGRRLRLSLSKNPALLGQGVVLISDDDRTAFNNQIETRITRKSGDIRRLIYEKLLSEE